MTPLATGFLFVGVLFALILLRVPIAVAMLASAIGGIVSIQGWTAAGFQLGRVPFSATEYALSVIPLFVLMGSLAARTGLARELYTAGSALVGHLRGGLALGTLLACAGFATVSGSSLATAATMGGVSLSEMRQRDYDDRLAAGSVAAGGTVGILIPPSVILVIYGILTETSIAQLFAAGLLPGLVLTGTFMATVAIWTSLAPGIAPVGRPLPVSERFRALLDVWAIVLLVIIVIGGIYTGWFTPTESAGVGAVGTAAIGLARRRLPLRTLIDSLMETAVTSAMIFLIIFGSALFQTFLTVTQIERFLVSITADSALAPMAILLIMLAVIVVLGCFMDSLGIVLLTVPVFVPIVIALDYDPIWFGVLLVMTVEMGLITPPVGLNVFIVKGVAPRLRLGQIYAGVAPFLLAFVVAVALILAIPGIALWLPGLVAR